MNHTMLLETIGREIRNEIVAARFGDASLHAAGYVLADPCYILPESIRSAFSEQRRAMVPDDARNEEGKLLRLAQWHAMTFRGHPCFWRDTSGDGCFFGHCVDSGGLVAVPLHLCKTEVQAVFVSTHE